MRVVLLLAVLMLFFKQKTADEMRISDWSSDVCSSDLFVQRTGEHRDTAVAGLTEQRHQIGKASRVVKGDDVGSRHSDVDHPSFAEMQQEIGRASCRERVCQ